MNTLFSRLEDPQTTAGLTILSLLALLASVLSVMRLRRADALPRLRRVHFSLTGICIAGTAGLFVYRSTFVIEGWQPLGSHLDGLLLISTLLAATVLFVQRAGIRGLSVFALPLFTLMLAWGICASVWTYEPFTAQSMWQTVHTGAVYLGSLFVCIAAAAGVMYLYAQRNLHQRRYPAVKRLASLESIERLMILTATMGFALLTLVLVTGLIMISGQAQTGLGAGWWYSPKIPVATVVWLIYAILMNVRYATAFRGARAAWLSIAGLVLLVVTFGLVQTLPELPKENVVQVAYAAADPPNGRPEPNHESGARYGSGEQPEQVFLRVADRGGPR